MTKSDFQLKNTSTVFKSEKIQIDRTEIKLPNNNHVNWDVIVLPDFFYAVPIIEDKVMFTKEWRLGPNTLLTQFTCARCTSADYSINLAELKRELREELGILGGDYQKLVTFNNGIRTTGITTYFLLSNFELTEPERDLNEIQEIIKLPIKGLYDELSSHHTVTADTLLLAKLLEEKFK